MAQPSSPSASGDDDEALAGALKTEDDFLDYVQSLRSHQPHQPITRSSPINPSTHQLRHHHQQQQKQQEQQEQEQEPVKHRRVRPPPTMPVPQVGLDHLDNLCRLMEQLSTLREQNTRLQKRVHYLEDLHAVRAELNLQRPQSEDSIIEASSAPSEQRIRSHSEDLSTCSPKSETKISRQHLQLMPADGWDSSIEDVNASDPSIPGIEAGDTLCIRQEGGDVRRQSSPLPSSHAWIHQRRQAQDEEEGRQGRSLDRGLRLQMPPSEAETSKKRNSAWGRVKTIIQTRRDSLRRRRQRPEAIVVTAPSELAINNDNEQVTTEEGKKGAGGGREVQQEADTESKWIKVKRAFLTRRTGQPSSLQRSQSVPSSPIDEDDIVLTTEDFVDEMDGERPLSEDLQRHLVEIQRNLSQEFNRKLVEWERMRRSGSTKQGRKRNKDLQWLDKELTKLARDKERLMRERRKFEEREARLQRLRRSLRLPRDDDDQVLVKTAAGEFRFPGISGSFTRRLLEWEEKLGLGPDVSTLALLDRSAAPPTNGSGAKLERNRSRSDSSIVEVNANSRTEDIADGRATSEPELPRMATPAGSAKSYGSLLDENLLLLENFRNKEETCCELQGQLEKLDTKLHEMIGNHSKELEKYRQQLEANQGATDPKLLADIQSHLRELHAAEQRLTSNREALEVSYKEHSEQQKVLAQELVDKMAELHSRSASNKEFRSAPEAAPVLRLPEVDVEKIQALSTDLLQQAQQLEEALSERNTMLRHLRWELMERETSALQRQSQPSKPAIPRRHWTSLEGISSPFSRKLKTVDDVPVVGAMSEVLQAKVKALHEGLVQLWTSTENSPHISQYESMSQEPEPSEPLTSIVSVPSMTPRESSPVTSREETAASDDSPTEPSGTVKARRMSDTTIQYVIDKIPFSSDSTEPRPLSRQRNSKSNEPEDRCPSFCSDSDFIVPGGILDFASAFSTAIYDEDALQPLSLPEPPTTAAAIVTTATIELQQPSSPSTLPEEQKKSTPTSLKTPRRKRRNVVHKDSSSYQPKPTLSFGSHSSTTPVPLASSDTDTDESPGITFTVRSPRFHHTKKEKESPKNPRQYQSKSETVPQEHGLQPLKQQKSEKHPQREEICPAPQEQPESQHQLPSKSEHLKQQPKPQEQIKRIEDEEKHETSLPVSSPPETGASGSSSLTVKPLVCPFSPILSRRIPMDTAAPNVRLMIAKFSQHTAPPQNDGVLKSSSFASQERPRPQTGDVAKSASASDCRPSTPCRLPTRVPHSPRMSGTNGNTTPRSTRSSTSNPETPSSVPVSPRIMKSAIRVPQEGLPSSVPSSPASRIPRPMLDNSPQSPTSRARALKLRHAKDEFLAREPSSPSSPEATRRVATVSPVIHQNCESHQETKENRLDGASNTHHHLYHQYHHQTQCSSQLQQRQQQQHQQQQKQNSNSTGVVATVKEMILSEFEESNDTSHAQKTGFFSFRFRKSKCKKKEGAPSAVEMLCRQSLLVDIPSTNEVAPPDEGSQQSCPSSPEVPQRCTRTKTSWLVKPKLFKQK